MRPTADLCRSMRRPLWLRLDNLGNTILKEEKQTPTVSLALLKLASCY